MTNKIFYLVVAVLIVGILVGAYYYTSKDEYSDEPSKYDEFASCLTENGFTMYGTYNCPFCNDQKKMFGNSFRNIDYVECTTDPKLCVEKDVLSVPQWINSTGESFVGLQSLETLSQISGCVLPEL